jgi:hypothetical protein
MSLAVKHVDPLDTVAAQGKSINHTKSILFFSLKYVFLFSFFIAVSFDFDEEFAKEAPGE